MIDIAESRIGIAGDWHGNTEWALKTLRAFAKLNITTVFQLGDFGIWGGHDSAKYILKVGKELSLNNQTLYVTPGNHEDYVRILSKEVDSRGVRVYQHERILLLDRGTRGTIAGRNFVSLGGANSIDFKGRVEGLSWWREESITLGDVYKTVEGGPADIFFSHDAPLGVEIDYSNKADGMGWGPDAIAYSNKGRESLRQAVDGLTPSILFHGHHHVFQDKSTALYNGAENYDLRTIGLACDSMPLSAIAFDFSSDTYDIVKVN
jgi:Icc-related predicted phosphoesterase